jgi:hypothetical protein
VQRYNKLTELPKKKEFYILKIHFSITFVLFFKKRGFVQGLPLYGEDATAPPVALTLW